MKLRDLLEELKLGDLANSPYIDLMNRQYIKRTLPTIFVAINSAIETLSTDFLLFQDRCKIETNGYLSEYPLHKSFARSNKNSNVPLHERFILDSDEMPFEDNVIKIYEVRDNYGNVIPLQDYGLRDTVCLSTPNTLIFPKTSQRELFIVYYYAKPHKIPLTETEYSDWEVEMPQAFMQAFKYLLLFNVYSYLKSMEGSKQAMQYFQYYQSQASKLKQENFAQTDFLPSVQPLTGWV